MSIVYIVFINIKSHELTLVCKKGPKKTSLGNVNKRCLRIPPVNYAACVSVEMTVVSHQPLLQLDQIDWLSVYGQSPNAALEGAERVLAVLLVPFTRAP